MFCVMFSFQATQRIARPRRHQGTPGSVHLTKKNKKYQTDSKSIKKLNIVKATLLSHVRNVTRNAKNRWCASARNHLGSLPHYKITLLVHQQPYETGMPRSHAISCHNVSSYLPPGGLPPDFIEKLNTSRIHQGAVTLAQSSQCQVHAWRIGAGTEA